MAQTENNYYKILGITRTANHDEIKHAYRMLAMKYHPDRNDGDKKSEELFKELQEAYQILSDTEKRKKYDLAKTWNFSFSYFQQVRHFFIVHTEVNEVLLNEEFSIVFTYTGEGRFFIKPTMPDFFITGKPLVSFKTTIIDGIEVKETSLEYIIAPLLSGNLIIDRASIKINNEIFQTEKTSIKVNPANCYFKKGEKGSQKPFKYDMNARIEAGSLSHKTIYHQNHTILLPRSDVARYYHNIGTIIKTASMIWGFFLFSVSDMNEFLGIFAGSLFGGTCCHIFYFITGVKSKCFAPENYPLVLSYKKKGYEKGKYTGSDYLTGKLFSWFSDLMT